MEYLNLNPDEKLQQYEIFKNTQMFNPNQSQIVYESAGIIPTNNNVQLKPVDNVVQPLPVTTPVPVEQKLEEDNERAKVGNEKEDTKSKSFTDAISEMKDKFSAELNSYLENLKIKKQQNSSDEGETVGNGSIEYDMSSYTGYSGPADLQQVMKRIGYAESNNNYGAVYAKTGNKGEIGSGAWGRYQMIWSHFKNGIKEVTGITNPIDFLKNPEAQDKFFEHYYNTNLLPAMHRFKKKFPNSGLNDMQIIEGLHFQGEGGFNEQYRAGTFKTKRIGNNPTVAARIFKNYSQKQLDSKPILKIPESQLKYFKKYQK